MTVNRPVTPGDIARATPAALEERSSRCGTIRDVEAKIKDGLTISNFVAPSWCRKRCGRWIDPLAAARRIEKG